MHDDGAQPSYIAGVRDNLDEVGAGFDRTPLAGPLFLNSVPKSGTHLIRNIVRMFVPEAQQWHREYIQIPNLRRNLQAFSQSPACASWGHLLFSDDSVLALKGVRHVLLVRDPYDWVLARARFYLSDEFQGSLNHIKNGAVSAEDVLNMMIVGVHQKSPSLDDVFLYNAVAWLGTGVRLVRYEDMVQAVDDIESKAAEAFFRGLLGDCGLAVPKDWRERVLAGADRKQSRTARENLTLGVELPETLPTIQRQLVDYVAPGLRALLGYA